ncbi:MAG: molybdopterin synthase sulfur carrier subunit [Gammaproteobacteria bacterium]|nr:MAG: molybdopterin synthase sulfur carrier subunit [Gammaproteobacteria bacterium]
MGIEVKFFASMRDLIGDDCEVDGEILKAESIKNVDDIWNYCAHGKERPANVLIAVNMDYVDARTLVKEGDEVAFFPPVTGG